VETDGGDCITSRAIAVGIYAFILYCFRVITAVGLLPADIRTQRSIRPRCFHILQRIPRSLAAAAADGAASGTWKMASEAVNAVTDLLNESGDMTILEISGSCSSLQ